MYKIIESDNKKILTNINIQSESSYKYTDEVYSFDVYDVIGIGTKYYSYIIRCNYSYYNINPTNYIRCMDHVYRKYSNTLVSKDIILLLRSMITKEEYTVKYEDTINAVSELINVLQIIDSYNHGISENPFSIFALYCHMKLIYKNRSEFIISDIIKNIKSNYKYADYINDVYSYSNTVLRYSNIVRDLIYQDTYYGCLHIPYISKITNYLSKIFIPNPIIPVEHYDHIMNIFYNEIYNECWEDEVDNDKWFVFKSKYNSFGTYYNGVFCKK